MITKTDWYQKNQRMTKMMDLQATNLFRSVSSEVRSLTYEKVSSEVRGDIFALLEIPIGSSVSQVCGMVKGFIG